MSISVKFRVVGIYLGANPDTPPTRENKTGEIEVNGLPNDPSAETITKAAEREINAGDHYPAVEADFTFTNTDSGKRVLKRASVCYEESPKPNRFEDCNFYTPRQFSLAMDMESSPILAWQYYVQDVKERGDKNESDELQQKNTDNEFVGADQDLDEFAEIKDGDLLTWRLVAIQNKCHVHIPSLPGPIRDLDPRYLDQFQPGPQVDGPVSPQTGDRGASPDDLDIDREQLQRLLEPGTDNTLPDAIRNGTSESINEFLSELEGSDS